MHALTSPSRGWGDLLVKTPEGEVALEVCKGPIAFNAKLHPRTVLPAQGRRVVLVLFTLDCEDLPAQDRTCLKTLGVRLPDRPQAAEDTGRRPRVLSVNQQKLLPRGAPSAGEGCNSLPPQGPCQLAEIPAQLQELAKPSAVPLMVEVCAGSAILSATAQACGWDALPIVIKCLAASSHTRP